MNKRHNISSIIDSLRLICNLKKPNKIISFLRKCDDTTVSELVASIANLIYNDDFQGHPLLKKKLNKLKKIMKGDSAKWQRVTRNANKGSKYKRQVLVEQAGSGNLLNILSTILPIVISLLL
jgi:hypothetical protein